MFNRPAPTPGRGRRRGLRRPEYYVFVTNVVLTGTHRLGSKDRVAEELERFASRTGRAGTRSGTTTSWAASSTRTQDVRTRYAAYVTTGDVLAAAMATFSDRAPDFLRVTSLFLQRELRADQFVRLEQAEWLGNVSPLHHVWADRPMPWADRVAEAYGSDPGRTGLVNVLALLAVSGSVFSVPLDLLDRSAFRAAVDRRGLPGLDVIAQVLMRFVQARTSAVGDETTWRRLGLPEVGDLLAPRGAGEGSIGHGADDRRPREAR